MRVSIPQSYRFTPAQADGALSTQAAAELQHVAFHALRAALGWHEGTFNAVTFNTLLREEGARIPQEGTWAEYRHVNRAGSRFCLDRRTRAAIFVAVKTTRLLS